ncbi:phosphate ABC transporter permease PstA [Spirulina sp. CS-785/01]|uniref:phosphate ABC transporter permease PstA n=1 Tax=Spirulina sp. CS-785/01 TaxID=3021716 RepID=UPI002330B28E|nr:phosphate ABC transporter permease PstA [Spirulina sp. CS-785/01]MDB9315757.1 phosphate ABC transporter permease PstA [Spirulina sp. CS-785/01]
MTTPDSQTFNKDQSTQEQYFTPNLSGRYKWDTVFASFTWLAVGLSVVILAVLLISVVWDGFPRLASDFWGFLTNFPSRKPEQAGLLSALVGTVWVMITVAIFAFPIGVGAGVYLEEFATDNWFTKLIEVNINNLAGVPSIIYGLLGLQLFVRFLEPMTGGRSILSGALTLALLILPIIIVGTREALRAVPDSIRQAGFALGATRWQVIWDQVFPIAIPGILTGTILALSRAIGETAPLITIGALTFISFLPENLQSQFTVLPIQIYNWVSRPQAGFHTNAAAGIIILMVVLLAMNGLAIFLRNKFQKRG